MSADRRPVVLCAASGSALVQKGRARIILSLLLGLMCGIKGNMCCVCVCVFAAVLLVLLLFWDLNMISICWIGFLLDNEGAEL